MKAITLDDHGLRLVEVDRPEPGASEALVRLRLAGICNTDLEIVGGYMSYRGILGHELLGDVVDAPGDALVGKRVVGEINVACGRCASCAAGLGRHCPSRTVLGILGRDGCFAEYVTLPVENLHVVPEVVSDDRAVFVEPLAAAFEILEQVQIEYHERVLVLGDGKLALLIAMVLAQTGCELTVAGRHENKLAVAAGLGATVTALEALVERDFDVVVEATGSPAGLGHALERVRPRGTVVIKSTHHAPVALDTAPVVVNELTLVGSRCGPYAPALAALEAGRVDPRPLVAATYPLKAGVHALGRAREPGVLKVLLDMRGRH